MSKKPIKRNEHIVSLSREHHFSLLFGWKIKNGLKFNIEPQRICKYVFQFWEKNLKAHFDQEEATLFNFKDDELINRALKEHVLIKAELKALQETEDEEQLILHLTQIADMVTDHVRFEERILFPHLEQKLTKEQLQNIGHDLNEMQPEPLVDDYEDAFWVKQK